MKKEKSNKSPFLVYALFFVSGFAALVYETSWSRMIGLVMGQTAQAAAIVLAAFFCGLAIGQYLGGKLAKRVSALLAYGAAEFCAASWGFAVPALFNVAADNFVDVAQTWPIGSTAFQAIVCFLILLPATIPLGSTLPFMVEVLKSREDSKKQSVRAYAWNTVGGLLGVIITSAWLLTFLGVQSSGYFAACLSAGCGLAACTFALSTRRRPFASAASGSHEIQRDTTSYFWTILVAISGVSTLGLEVLYTRMFALIFHNSTYTFAAVIVAFLLALALAAGVVPLLRTRYSARRIVITSLLLGSFALAASILVFRWSTELSYFSFGHTFATYLLGVLGLVTVFVMPPIFCLGLILPVAIHENANSQSIGSLSAINTLASAVGSILAGFFLPQLLGLWASFGLIVVLLAICGATFLVEGKATWYAVSLTMASCLLALFVAKPLAFFAGDLKAADIVKRWESDYGMIDVVRSPDGVLSIRQNLHYRHGSTGSMANQYRMGRIPLLLHPDPADVAFLGIGTGLTVAPTVFDDKVQRVQVVELIPEVVEAAKLLNTANLGVLEHAKTSVQIDDARHFLKRDQRQYDVIVSDLFVPWESKSGYLYTVDFYEVVRRRMKHGGLFCQWIAINQVGRDDFEMIANSFASIFPNTMLWWGRYDERFPVIALVGSEQPINLDKVQLQERLVNWGKHMPYTDVELQTPDALIEHVVGNWSIEGTAKLNTDEHPWLEFSAPLSHRNETTLAGKRLQNYFDDVLSKLQIVTLAINGKHDSSVNLRITISNLQRFVIFGDLE